MAVAGVPETESRRCLKGCGHRRAMLCWSWRLVLTSIHDPNLGVPLTFLESLTSAWFQLFMFLWPYLQQQSLNHIILCDVCPLNICLSTPRLDQGCDLFILGGSGTHTVNEVLLLLDSSCSSGQRSKASGALGQRLRSWSLASPFAFLVASSSPSFPLSSCTFLVSAAAP